MAIRTRHTTSLALLAGLAVASGCSSSRTTTAQSSYTPDAKVADATQNPDKTTRTTTDTALKSNTPAAFNPFAPDLAVSNDAGATTAYKASSGNTDQAFAARRTFALAPTGAGTGASGGGNYQQISFSLEGADFDPCISHDGAHVVFASTQHRPTADLYLKSVDGRTVTQLTSDPGQDVMPTFNPDGSRIAFASNRGGNWDIYVMPATGGKAMQVTSDTGADLHPTWSPDGTQLAFCRFGQTSGKWEIWVTDVNNTAVTRFLGYGMFPEWSPAAGTGPSGGDRILFQRSRERGDRAFAIWSIEYKNGQAYNPTEVVSLPGYACINPTFSPDGNWIAFATVPAGNTGTSAARPTSAELWMVNADGSGRVNLVSGSGINLMPTWGPDNRVYFISDRGGVDNIWATSTTGAILAATGKNPDSYAKTSSTHARPHSGHAAQAAHGQPAPELHGPTPNHETATVPEPRNDR